MLMIRIAKTQSAVEREPLVAPFGFKGGYLSELWQSAVLLESESGKQGLGLGTQSTLWSDAGVFTSMNETDGNAVMHRMTIHALELARSIPFETPIELLTQLLEPTWEYGKQITGRNNLRMTFALNALVAVDNAAWQLMAAEQDITLFDQMVPASLRSALSRRAGELAAVPLMSYGVPLASIVKTVDDGCFFLKIKIGSDPDGDGDLDKMLAWDKRRLLEIHEALKNRETPYTDSGHIPYYLDANGRYDTKERLIRFLDHADSIGALDRILLLEEPFPEECLVDVSDLPVRLVADESAHSDKEALDRIELGYRAIALKPIAKTMSMSLKIAQLAHDRGVPCFCADLTVNPILVDWNKNIAARLAPLPGMKVGVLESNGHQNYKNWERMKSYHPCHGAPWTEVCDGLFHPTDDFYDRSGGIFEISPHYKHLVSK
ncbi:MAG: L-alanine-DL-glutamate epimerase [Verrucomicrobia bacterium]|nr:L-alanine-DL-glutamate epimerase [Verrucomicrobiota bacterium]